MTMMTARITLTKRLGIDIETYSDKDIKDCGAYAYAESPAFEILLIGYLFDGDTEPTVIDLSDYRTKEEAVDYIELCYPEFYEALTDPSIIKTAYNANFERTCLTKYFGKMDPKQWQCTAVRAATLGLPRSLADVGSAIGLAEDKQKLATGKALITYFCKPCKPTKANGQRTRNFPYHDKDKWELFKQYNAQDVVAEQAILKILLYFDSITPFEQRLWEFDQDMNDRGVLLDIDMIEKIIDFDDRNTQALKEEAAVLTGLANPNSLAQLKKWLWDQGYPMESITKDTVADALAGECPDNVRRALEIRQLLGKTSTKKYKAMINAVNEDNRLRGVLQFYGANRSGRWAGRIVQVHNLPQNKFPDIDFCRELAAEGRFDDMEVLFGELPFAFSQLIRTSFIASEDSTFVVSDFSAIEARVIAWLADEKWRIEAFEQGKDIYCVSASKMFGIPVEKHGVNGHLRQRGKVAELALGYQGGVGAMIRMDTTGTIPQEDMPGIVQSWREASPRICKLWRQMELAAKTCITGKRTVRIDKGIEFSFVRGVMLIKLPSGRKLAYWDARIETMADGKEHITYGGINQETKKWERSETYGGKLVENVVQAIARDLLAYCMLRVDDAGYNIAFHIHDEMIVDVPDAKLEEARKTIDAIMADPPEWAKGLPLRGDGYITKHYKKD